MKNTLVGRGIRPCLPCPAIAAPRRTTAALPYRRRTPPCPARSVRTDQTLTRPGAGTGRGPLGSADTPLPWPARRPTPVPAAVPVSSCLPPPERGPARCARPAAPSPDRPVSARCRRTRGRPPHLHPRARSRSLRSPLYDTVYSASRPRPARTILRRHTTRHVPPMVGRTPLPTPRGRPDRPAPRLRAPWLAAGYSTLHAALQRPLTRVASVHPLSLADSTLTAVINAPPAPPHRHTLLAVPGPVYNTQQQHTTSNVRLRRPDATPDLNEPSRLPTPRLHLPAVHGTAASHRATPEPDRPRAALNDSPARRLQVRQPRLDDLTCLWYPTLPHHRARTCPGRP